MSISLASVGRWGVSPMTSRPIRWTAVTWWMSKRHGEVRATRDALNPWLSSQYVHPGSKGRPGRSRFVQADGWLVPECASDHGQLVIVQVRAQGNQAVNRRLVH